MKGAAGAKENGHGAVAIFFASAAVAADGFDGEGVAMAVTDKDSALVFIRHLSNFVWS